LTELADPIKIRVEREGTAMENVIRGKVYVLGDNVDTDQIIPAEHLVYATEDPEERLLFGRYALSGVPEKQAGLPRGGVRFVPEGSHSSEYKIILAGWNFGCGSSREHAPLALHVAGVEAVVAPSYARIFYRNSVNGGYLCPIESEESLVPNFATGDEAEIDIPKGTIKNVTKKKTFPIRPLGDVEAIIRAGGVFAYARETGMIEPVIASGAPVIASPQPRGPR
jgi:3-isopropylmalate/(R)-2-methylmalate dehydratase small subunit